MSLYECKYFLHLCCLVCVKPVKMATTAALQVLNTKPPRSSAVGNDGIIIDPHKLSPRAINAFLCVFHADSSQIKLAVAERRHSADQKATTEEIEIYFLSVYVLLCFPEAATGRALNRRVFGSRLGLATAFANICLPLPL